MLAKAQLVSILVVGFSQIIAGQDLNDCEWFATIGAYEYCIYNKIEISRIGAQAICENANMTLITFERNGTFDNVWRWIVDQGLYYDSWWTGGKRDRGSTTWYWESTGNAIDYFYWEPSQPDLENDTSSEVCLFFRASLYSGWHDVQCNSMLSYAICQLHE